MPLDQPAVACTNCYPLSTDSQLWPVLWSMYIASTSPLLRAVHISSCNLYTFTSLGLNCESRFLSKYAVDDQPLRTPTIKPLASPETVAAAESGTMKPARSTPPSV